VGDVWRFALIQRLFNQQVVNTFACQIDAAPAVKTETQFVDDLFADATGRFNSAGGMRQAFRGAQTTEVTHLRWEVIRVTQPTTQMFVRNIVTDPTGQDATTAETANISASITRRGTLGGKRHRGRIAVAGLPTSGIAAGVFTAPTTTDLGVIATFLRGGYTLADGTHFNMGYWSPAHEAMVNGQVTVYAPLFVLTATSVVQSTVRVQRSRTVGVGA
jgi:hypothetical protein